MNNDIATPPGDLRQCNTKLPAHPDKICRSQFCCNDDNFCSNKTRLNCTASVPGEEKDTQAESLGDHIDGKSKRDVNYNISRQI